MRGFYLRAPAVAQVREARGACCGTEGVSRDAIEVDPDAHSWITGAQADVGRAGCGGGG